jgi:hypothetical protein
MPRECKKYNLRSTRKPAKNALLSTVVKVRDEEGKDGHCYVGFDAPLVEAVGKKLPRGVAPYDPAYLVVEYDALRQLWIVGARYIRTDDAVVLWETAAMPVWLKVFYPRGNHGNNRSSADGTTSRVRRNKARPPQGSGHTDQEGVPAPA